MSHLKRGVCGQVDAANVAQGGRRTLALPWWAFARAGGEAEGDGGGLLENTGMSRVETHLKGPMAVLLVLVSHSEGARQAGRARGGGGAQASKCGGGGDEKMVVTSDMGSSRL